jgi:hypothetical protein
MYRSYVMTPTIARKSGKRRKPMGSTGKYSLPCRGDKTKQTKVTPAKESETKGSRQTKLSFLTTGNDISPPTTIGTTKLKAITPEEIVITPAEHDRTTNGIHPPSPPTNPESPPTTRKHTPNSNTNTDDITKVATTTETPPPQSNTVTSNDDAKNPAARTSNTTSIDEFKEPVAPTETEFTLVKKPPRRTKKVTTKLTPPKLAKKDKLETPTPPNPDKPTAPQEPSKLSQNSGLI